MRFIRTKDGKIINVSLMQEYETDDENGNRIFDGYEDKDGTYYPIENILKQANTIEELCDVFVGVDKNGKHYTNSESVNDLIHMTQDILHVTLTTIYGEIWVNDELHKVAKLNDKGELELL